MPIAVLVLGDSRGRGISGYLKQHLNDSHVYSKISPGVNYRGILENLEFFARKLRKQYSKVIAIVIAGICNFTEKKVNGEIQYTSSNKVEQAKQQLNNIWDYAQASDIHVVITTIIPADLQKANKYINKERYTEPQISLNSDIEEINQFILGSTRCGSVLNLFREASLTSVKRFGKYRQKIRKFRKLHKTLLSDGVHPTKILQDRINIKVLEFVNLVRASIEK